tara:strand:+ start:936 stop:1190 length:255 start_codon:yes stop_codon:yes gene_type:complete
VEALSKTTGVPAVIVEPDIVKMMLVPKLEFPLSVYVAIADVSESLVTAVSVVAALSKTTGVPAVIVEPDTSNTQAVPYVLAPSL